MYLSTVKYTINKLSDQNAYIHCTIYKSVVACGPEMYRFKNNNNKKTSTSPTESINFTVAY